MEISSDILSLLSVPLIGLVPEDDGIIISTNRGVPAAHDPKIKSGQAYRRIAARVEGEEVPFPDMSSENGLFNKIRSRVGLMWGVQSNA